MLRIGIRMLRLYRLTTQPFLNIQKNYASKIAMIFCAVLRADAGF